jgi:TolB protein
MSNGGRRKLFTWLIGGATFVIVVASTSGCCFRKSSEAQALESAAPMNSTVEISKMNPPRPPDAGLSFANVPVAQEAPPPMVNLFGEFDGVERLPTKTSSEAGFEQHTYLDEGYDGDVAVSPDGRWIVFSSTRHSEHADIYLQRVGGMSVTELTSDSSDDAFPCFSSDGSRIAFCSTRSGNWDIFVMDSDGKNVTQITSGPSQDIHPSFSPDGSRLVYCSMGSRSGQWELWTVDLNTNQKKMIGFGLFPSWSPEKSTDRIAFQRSRARGSRWFSIWTLELVDGEARHNTEVAVSSNAAIVSPVWSPDGSKLAFSTIVDPARSTGTKPAGQQDVWTVNLDGTNRHRITDGNGTNATPFWASDNRIYFVSDRGGTECIWSARADGSTSFAKAKSAQKDAVTGADTKELPH